MTLPGADEATCSGCGKRVLWILTKEGKRVPLDPTPPTYGLHVLNDAADPPTFEWRRTNGKDVQEPVFVSHFATCTKANDFSWGGR